MRCCTYFLVHKNSEVLEVRVLQIHKCSQMASDKSLQGKLRERLQKGDIVSVSRLLKGGVSVNDVTWVRICLLSPGWNASVVKNNEYLLLSPMFGFKIRSELMGWSVGVGVSVSRPPMQGNCECGNL